MGTYLPVGMCNCHSCTCDGCTRCDLGIAERVAATAPNPDPWAPTDPTDLPF